MKKFFESVVIANDEKHKQFRKDIEYTANRAGIKFTTAIYFNDLRYLTFSQRDCDKFAAMVELVSGLRTEEEFNSLGDKLRLIK